MNRVRRYLASIPVIVISTSLSFSNNSLAETDRAIEQKSSEEEKENVETTNSALGTFTSPSAAFIVASTAGIGLFSAVVSYWYLARIHAQPINGVQNAGLAIMGAMVQATLPENHVSPQHGGFHEVDGELNTLDQQAGLSLDILLQHEQSDLDLQTHPVKEDETTDQAVVEEVVEKPKRRAKKTIAGTQELIESAQRFLGHHDYSAPRASRHKKEKK